ncbi:MAG: hypothetical protein HOM01_08220 [Kordiimonadaceae bacterium]|nr:hypothetical protein [Kordiimonadaceae bacterium]MDB2423267.1 FecR domain-containing protein [Paracoccaceae bacterium]
MRLFYFIFTFVLVNFPYPIIAEIGQIIEVYGKVQIRTNKAEIIDAKVGTKVAMYDMLKVRNGASATISLNDKSIFTVGSKTTLVFDDFIYDQENQKLRLRIIDGALTFKNSDKNLKSDKKFIYNKFTLTIRGTEFAAKFRPDSQIILLDGAVAVDSRDNTRVIDSPLQSVTFGYGKISEPMTLTQKELKQFLKDNGLDAFSNFQGECFMNKIKIRCP